MIKKTIAVLCGLVVILAAVSVNAGEVFYRPYGEATKVLITLYGTDGVDIKVDASFENGDVIIMDDEGAEDTSQITTSDITDEGHTYSITFSASDMEVARKKIIVKDPEPKTWLADTWVVETYGHASAQHPTFPADVLEIEGSDATDQLVAYTWGLAKSTGTATIGSMGKLLQRIYDKVK